MWSLKLPFVIYSFRGIGNWEDQLCWCPSQCSKYYSYKGVECELYLRWRWSDPWRYEIIIGGEKKNILI